MSVSKDICAMAAFRRWKRGVFTGGEKICPSDDCSVAAVDSVPGCVVLQGNPGDPLSDADPGFLPTSCSPPNANQGAVCSGADQKRDTSKRGRKREVFVHDEPGADQKPDTSTRRRIRHKQGIAPIPGSVSPHALTPTVPRSTLSYDGHSPCLAMFLKLSDAQKKKLRRSVREAKNKVISSFKKYQVISIRGEEHVWPIDPVQQSHILRLVSFKLYELYANDSATCPFRRGAAMEYLIKTMRFGERRFAVEQHGIKTGPIGGVHLHAYIRYPPLLLPGEVRMGIKG